MKILLLILGAGALYLLERILYRKLWDRGLSMKVEFTEKSAFEGDRSTLLEVVENRNFLPLVFLHAKFELGAGLVFENRENVSTSDMNYKNDIFSVLFYQRVRRRLPFTCAKRGYYYVNTADLVSTDLFYDQKMVGNYPQSTDFYVYPGAVDLSRFEEPFLKMVGEVTSRQFLYPDPFEFRGIRAYTLEDPLNTINWKASAKTGELMVNQFDSTVSRKLMIFLNVQDETVVEHHALHEESIRIAAALAAESLEKGLPVSFVCNGRDILNKEPAERIDALGKAQLEDIYRMLSRIDLKQKKESMKELVSREAGNPDFREAGYILISSSQEKELMEAFSAIGREASAIHLVPLYKNMDFHPEESNAFEQIRWEVKGYA